MTDKRPAIAVEGDFLSNGPIAIVNRGLFGALSRIGKFELAVRSEPGAFPVSRADGAAIEAMRRVRLPAGADVTVRHAWPPATANVARGAYVHIQGWEFGALPAAWAQAWSPAVDDVWCFSRHVAQTYRDAGFPSERVHVVPLGIDPATFSPEGPRRVGISRRRCTFLYVGRTIRRKGIDLAIESFLRAFSARDDVELVIKDIDPPGVAAMESARESILSLCERQDLPRIAYVGDEFSEAAAMADLYRSASCLVLPYRAEAFGLTALEGMACGLPAIVTRGGATDDFVPEDGSYPIDAVRVETGTGALSGEGWILQPEPAQIIEAMRRVYADPTEARARGKLAAKAAAEWTWDRSAAHAADRLSALSAEPGRRSGLWTGFGSEGFPAPNGFEDKVWSQNGEDGIILELFRQLGVERPFFVELGVEDGRECNTARLAIDLGWRGVMVEGDPALHAGLAERFRDYPGVQAVSAFLTRENVLDVFAAATVPVELDLLSIDIDGNDYWIFERLGGVYRPRVVIAEINPAHPPPELWVMAYDSGHRWKKDDYYGASLQSMTALADRLGYALVAMESRSVNAFFVRRDLLAQSGFTEVEPVRAFRPPTYGYPKGEGPALEV